MNGAINFSWQTPLDKCGDKNPKDHRDRTQLDNFI